MRIEYAYKGNDIPEGATVSGPFLCVIFEHVSEDKATQWAIENDFGVVFPVEDKNNPGKSTSEWEVDCYNIYEADFIKACWEAWCIDRGLV